MAQFVTPFLVNVYNLLLFRLQMFLSFYCFFKRFLIYGNRYLSVCLRVSEIIKPPKRRIRGRKIWRISCKYDSSSTVYRIAPITVYEMTTWPYSGTLKPVPSHRRSWPHQWRFRPRKTFGSTKHSLGYMYVLPDLLTPQFTLSVWHKASSFRGQKILQPGYPWCTFSSEKVYDFF